MTDKQDKFDPLEDLFAQARAARPEASDPLMQRVLADADAVQQAAVSEAAPPVVGERAAARNSGPGSVLASVVRFDWLRPLTQALGGWAGMGGLAAACATGVWIGIAPPATWPDPAMLVWQDQSGLDLFQDQEVALIWAAEEG